MRPFAALIVLCAALSVHAQEMIQDPIQDYLDMQVPDRTENVGKLLILKKVSVDLAGDGRLEVFVGTWYRNSGPNTWLWAGYAPASGGYERITSSDVLIDFENIYVGPLPEVHRQGMAQAYSLELDQPDRDQSNVISDVTFYYLEGRQLIQKGSGAIDRSDPAQEKFYNFYFGPSRRVRGAPLVQAFTVADLIRAGYRLPAWARPNLPRAAE